MPKFHYINIDPAVILPATPSGEHRIAMLGPIGDDYSCDERPEPPPTPTKAPRPRRAQIGAKIKAQYADGKFRPLERMAEKLEVDVEHLRATLDRLTWNNVTYYGCKAERKKVNGVVQYQIVKIEKTVSQAELVDKLVPIVKELREQVIGKTMVTMSLASIALCAGKLQKLLDEWTE